MKQKGISVTNEFYIKSIKYPFFTHFIFYDSWNKFFKACCLFISSSRLTFFLYKFRITNSTVKNIRFNPLTSNYKIRVNQEEKGKMARKKTCPVNFVKMNWYQRFIRKQNSKGRDVHWKTYQTTLIKLFCEK